MANTNGVWKWIAGGLLVLVLSIGGVLGSDIRDTSHQNKLCLDSIKVAAAHNEAAQEAREVKRDYQMAIITRALGELLNEELPVYVDTTDTNGHLRDST